jgi:hypothetical protein
LLTGSTAAIYGSRILQRSDSVVKGRFLGEISDLGSSDHDDWELFAGIT